MQEAGAEAEPGPFGPGNPARPSLRYVFLRFLRVGFLAWGGPVAQIALLHRELVERDGWASEERFRKTLALYQALPGPEAHEMAVWFGMLKRGRAGGFLAGLGFMLPGVALVTLLAAVYVRAAGTAEVAALLLHGVKPAVLGLIAAGFVRLATRSAATPLLALVAIGSAAAGLLAPGVGFLPLLAAGGLAALLAQAVRARTPPAQRAGGAAPLLLVPLAAAATFPALAGSGMLALAGLMAKVGLLTFGGAYTAIPFLQQGAVVEHGWITDAQFLDALALAGLVPGPLVAVGTIVGYFAGGLAGAALATVLIFAPAFAFTLLGHGLFERLVDEPRLHAFLLGVTAAVVGLILVAVVPLARAAVVDLPTALLAVAAFALLATRRAPIPLVIAGGALAGLVLRALPA